MLKANEIPRINQYREILRKKKVEECKNLVFENNFTSTLSQQDLIKIETILLMENNTKIDNMTDLELFQDYIETLTVEEMNGRIFLLHNFMDGKDHKIANIGEMVLKLTIYKKMAWNWLTFLYKNREKQVKTILREKPFEEGIFYLLANETSKNLLELDKKMVLKKEFANYTNTEIMAIDKLLSKEIIKRGGLLKIDAMSYFSK